MRIEDIKIGSKYYVKHGVCYPRLDIYLVIQKSDEEVVVEKNPITEEIECFDPDCFVAEVLPRAEISPRRRWFRKTKSKNE